MDEVYSTLVGYDLSDDSMRRDFVNKFPAAFNHDDESNNQKLLNLIADLFIDQKNNLLSTHWQLRINSATGGNLTELAKQWGVNRIDDDDDFLRFEIYVKIFQKRFGATERGTKEFIAKSLDIDIDSFQILPSDNMEDIYVNNLPFNFKDNNKKEIKQAILFQAIQDNIPPTFKLTKIVYAVTDNIHLYAGANGGQNVNIDEKKKYNRNLHDNKSLNAATISGINGGHDEKPAINRLIYDPYNGLHIATSTEINSIIDNKNRKDDD